MGIRPWVCLPVGFGIVCSESMSPCRRNTCRLHTLPLGGRKTGFASVSVSVSKRTVLVCFGFGPFPFRNAPFWSVSTSVSKPVSVWLRFEFLGLLDHPPPTFWMLHPDKGSCQRAPSMDLFQMGCGFSLQKHRFSETMFPALSTVGFAPSGSY